MTAAMPSLGIVKREFLSGLRQTRSFLILGVFVLALSGVALSYWPSGSFAVRDAGAFSREFLYSMAIVIMTCCGLLVPAYAAISVSVEKEQGTFDFLHLTLVRPSGLVFAKVVNSIGFFLFLILGILPVFATVFFLVGIDTREVLQLLLIAFLMCVACAAIGVMVSSRCTRAMWAIALSYAGTLAYLGIGPLLAAFLGALVLAPFVDIRNIGFVLETGMVIGSPVATVIALRETGSILPAIPFLLSLGYSLSVALICGYLSLRTLREQPLPPRVEEFKPIDDLVVLRMRKRQFPYYLIDPMKRKKPVEDHRNPMMVKEIRWGFASRASALVRLFYVALGIYLFAGAGAWLGGRDYTTVYGWLFMQIMLTIGVAPALLANTFTKELELGNLEMLRMTLLTPGEIVRGKLMAGLIALAPLLGAATLTAVWAAIMGFGEFGLMTAGYLTLALCAFLCLCMGLLVSMLVRRTHTALAVSYLAAIMLFFGGSLLAKPLAANMLWKQESNYYQAGDRSRPSPSQSVADYLSPVMAFRHNALYTPRIESAQRSISRISSRTGETRNELRTYGDGFTQSDLFNVYWLSNVALFAGLGWGVQRQAVRLFRRRLGRDV